MIVMFEIQQEEELDAGLGMETAQLQAQFELGLILSCSHSVFFPTKSQNRLSVSVGWTVAALYIDIAVG